MSVEEASQQEWELGLKKGERESLRYLVAWAPTDGLQGHPGLQVSKRQGVKHRAWGSWEDSSGGGPAPPLRGRTLPVWVAW